MKQPITLSYQLDTMKKIRKPVLPKSRAFVDRKKAANKKACRKA